MKIAKVIIKVFWSLGAPGGLYTQLSQTLLECPTSVSTVPEEEEGQHPSLQDVQEVVVHQKLRPTLRLLAEPRCESTPTTQL